MNLQKFFSSKRGFLLSNFLQSVSKQFYCKAGSTTEGCPKPKEHDELCVNVVLEAAFNAQINRELQCGHEYFSMAQFFFRNKIALQGFGNHFLRQSIEELNHARDLCKYQNLRGCQVKIQGLLEPKYSLEKFSTCAVDALGAALKLELEMVAHLNELYKMAEATNDLHAMDFIVKTLMHSQVKEISKIQTLLAKLKNFNDTVGLFLIDQQLLQGKPLE